ncbi:unnamed protein product, partial [Pylaiella littoralis]
VTITEGRVRTETKARQAHRRRTSQPESLISYKPRRLIRPGEKEAFFLAIQEDPPESESGTTRRAKKWTDIANRMLVVKDIDVAKQGVTNKVRVDYQQGRPPVDPKELGIKLKNLFSRYKTNFDKEE